MKLFTAFALLCLSASFIPGLFVDALIRQNLTAIELEKLESAVAELLEVTYNAEDDCDDKSEEILVEYDEFLLQRPINMTVVDGRIAFKFNASLSKANMKKTIEMETLQHPGVKSNYTVEMKIANCWVHVEGHVAANRTACQQVSELYELDNRSRIRVLNVTSAHLEPMSLAHAQVLLTMNAYFNAPDEKRIIFYNNASPSTTTSSEEEDEHDGWRDDCSDKFKEYLKKHDLILDGVR